MKTLLNIMYYPKGRISRGQFAVGFLILNITLGLMRGFLIIWEETITAVAFILLTVVVIVGNIIMMTKRFHDLDMSGSTILVGLIPFVGQFIFIWYWLELLFKQGTQGENHYGPEPTWEKIELSPAKVDT